MTVMLQKIENFYLAILRVVVIGVAGVLLAAVVYFGLDSLGAIAPAPDEVAPSPQVSPNAFKAALLGQPASNDGNEEGPPSVSAPTIRDDYKSAARVLADFYSRRLSYHGSINTDILAEVFSEVGETYSTEELNRAFATGFLAQVRAIVADEEFYRWASNEDPEDALPGIIYTYKADFDRQVAEVDAANQRAQLDHAANKAESIQRLYVAGVAFVGFLLIVFLSIAIRIERNLRPLPQV